MKTIIQRNFRALFLLLIISCNICSCKGKDDSPEVTPVVTDKDPAQYNTPFAKVPDSRDLTIYQVNIRTFSNEGNLKGVTARLDSIKALGVNVVYLMPIYPVGELKSVNSPYCVKDYKAVNKEFGTLDDLRELVDGAHARNMAVMLDWVANHTSFDHVWISNTSWYLKDASGNITSPPGMGWTDVAQLNFSNNEMRKAMIKAMKYWVYTANIDGFRCDYADGPPADFWKQAIDTLHNITTHKLLMLAEGKRSANYSSGFDLNFGFNFYEKLKSIYSGNQQAQEINQLNESDYQGASGGQGIVRYITNHDVNSSDGTPSDLFGGTKGSMAAFIVAAYMKSVPMIYNGQEVALPYKLNFPFTAEKINWTLNPEAKAEYKKVIAFRNRSEAVRRGTLTSFSSSDVVAFSKESAQEKVVVLSNLRNKEVSFSLPSNLANTPWKDAFTGSQVSLGTQISLPSYSWLVLTN